MSTCLKLEFEVPSPYSLWHSVRFQRLGRLDPRAQLSDNHYIFASNVRSGPATAEVRCAESKLNTTIWGPGSEELAELLPAQLGLDQPILADGATGLPRTLRSLQAAGIRRTARGLQRVDETLLPLILQQLVTWREAATSWRALLDRYGTNAPGPHGLRLAPTLPVFARLSLADYRQLGIGSKRAKTIRTVAQRASRTLTHREDTKPAQSQCATFLDCPGIGPWTRAFYQGLELGMPDAVPTGDYHLPSTVSWVFAQQRRSTDLEMLRILEPYAGSRFEIIRLVMASNAAAPRRNPRMPQRRVTYATSEN